VLEVNETSANIENNTSTISWQLWIERGSTWAYDLNDESLAEVKINGQSTLSKYVSFDLRNSQWVTFGSGTMTVPHNEDGSKSITISARLTNVSNLGDIDWFSGTVNLSSIPRASAIQSVTSTELGKPVTVTIAKKVADFSHQVWWQVSGGGWVDLGKNHDTSAQFTVPIEYAKRITNSANGTLDVCVRTFQGNTRIGEDAYLNGTSILVPENIVPTLESVSTSERTAQLAEFVPKGNFVKDKSVIRLEAVGAKGAYGSTIVSTELYLGNLVVRANQGDFPANSSGNLTATAKVTDSRGRTATKSIQIHVADYYAPKILAFLANRAGNGTNKTIISTVLANVSPVMINGTNINRYTLKIQYSEKGTNRWIDVVNLTEETTEVINRQIDSGAFYALDKPYNLRLVIQDRISDLADSIILVRSSEVLIALGDGRIGFGGFPELKNQIEFFKATTMHNSLNVEGGIMSNGKAIQEFADTDKNGKSVRFNGNLNNLRTAGGYHAFGVQNNPTGTNNYGYVNVITHSTDNNHCVQMYIPSNNDSLYIRRCDSNRWGDWIQVVTTGVDTGWKTANLQSGWQHRLEYGSVQFAKTVDGIVYLRGVAGGGRISKETIVFVLPEGYRPKTQLYIYGMNDSFGLVSLSIAIDGRVVIKKNADDKWLGFDTVSFKI
jgi:hypothetical protein